MKRCNMILTEKQQKYQHYHQVKLTNINILQSIMSQSKEGNGTSTVYFYSFRQSFWKTNKIIEDKGKKQIKAREQHGKRLVKSNDKIDSWTPLKQKEIFDKLNNEKMDEIWNLSEKLLFIIELIF